MIKIFKKIVGIILFPFLEKKIALDCISGKSLNKLELFVLGQVNTKELVSPEIWASSAGNNYFSCQDHLMTEDDYEKDTIYRKPYMDKLVEFIKENDFTTIIEYGCGRGDNLGYIRKILSDVRLIGTDINRLALDSAIARWPDIEFIEEKITNAAEKISTSGSTLSLTCSVLMYLDNMTLRNFLRSFCGGGGYSDRRTIPRKLGKVIQPSFIWVRIS